MLAHDVLLDLLMPSCTADAPRLSFYDDEDLFIEGGHQANSVQSYWLFSSSPTTPASTRPTKEVRPAKRVTVMRPGQGIFLGDLQGLGLRV